jgi:aspartate kinase
LANNNTSVDLVSVSEVSVSITLDNDEKLKEVIRELSTFSSVNAQKNLTIVSLIGQGIVSIKHILQQIFTALDNANIAVQMISLGATDINISLVTNAAYGERAVTELHNRILLPYRQGGMV